MACNTWLRGENPAAQYYRAEAGQAIAGFDWQAGQTENFLPHFDI